MPDFSVLHRWERFAPDLGDNRQRPDGDRLWLEVKSSMTRAELVAFDRGFKELHLARTARLEQYMSDLKADGADREALKVAYESEVDALVTKGYTDALSPVVRLVGRHTLSGAPVSTLGEYLGAVAGLSDGYNILELAAAVKDANSVGGSTQLFSGRRSGGWAGTADPNSAED